VKKNCHPRLSASLFAKQILEALDLGPSFQEAGVRKRGSGKAILSPDFCALTSVVWVPDQQILKSSISSLVSLRRAGDSRIYKSGMTRGEAKQ